MSKHRNLTKDEFDLLNNPTSGTYDTKKYDTAKRLAERGLLDIIDVVGEGQAQVFRYIITDEGQLEARRSLHSAKGRP